MPFFPGNAKVIALFEGYPDKRSKAKQTKNCKLENSMGGKCREGLVDTQEAVEGGVRFEETFENSQWRRVKQMQPM